MPLLSNEAFRAVNGVLVKRVSTGVPIIMPQPSTFTFQSGIEEIITESRDNLGNRVNASSYIDAFKPVFQLTIPQMTFTMLCAYLGREVSNANVDTRVYRTFRVTTSNQTSTGAAVGQLGNGMAADQATSFAYVLGEGGVATALTRIANATIDLGVDTQSFSQSANAGYKLTNDLIGDTVLIDFAHSLTAVPTLSETALLELSVNVSVVTVGGQVVLFEMPTAYIDLSQGDIEIGAEGATIAFRSGYDGSSCQPVNITYTGEVVYC